MGTYFIADQHFFHKKIIEFEKRSFASLDAMHEAYITTWNNVVKNEDDIVYILGDFSFGNYDQTVAILEQLRGRKRLVAGNHDHSKVWDKIMARTDLVEEYHEVATKIKHNKHILYLSHFPLEIGLRPMKWSIHGHIHRKPTTWINQINVGVDSYTFQEIPHGQPIHIDQLFKIIEKRNAIFEREFLQEKKQ